METTELRRPTMEDIAARTGLSKATVCRVVNGQENVAAGTREAVNRAIKELGYRPNPALSALARHRWNAKGSRFRNFTLALVSTRDPGLVDAGELGKLTAGLEANCREMELGFEVFHLAHYRSTEALGRILYHRGVDGIIADVAQPMVDWKFPWQHFAAVTVGYDHPSHRHHSVCTDHIQTVTTGYEMAKAAGSMKPAFAVFSHGHPDIDRQIRAAVLHCLWLENPKRPPVERVFTYTNEQTADSVPAAFARWIEKVGPDHVVDGNSIAVWWLRAMGRSDIRYSSLVEYSNHGEVMFSGADLQYELQVQIALEKALGLLQLHRRGPAEFPVRSYVPSRWVEVKPERRSGGRTAAAKRRR